MSQAWIDFLLLLGFFGVFCGLFYGLCRGSCVYYLESSILPFSAFFLLYSITKVGKKSNTCQTHGMKGLEEEFNVSKNVFCQLNDKTGGLKEILIYELFHLGQKSIVINLFTEQLVRDILNPSSLLTWFRHRPHPHAIKSNKHARNSAKKQSENCYQSGKFPIFHQKDSWERSTDDVENWWRNIIPLFLMSSRCLCARLFGKGPIRRTTKVWGAN